MLILPRGVLTSKEEKECRRYYIEKGWLKAAISLPEKMFESTSVSTCILLFDRKKTSKDVMLISAERMKSVEVREQRGEGDASHYNRIYKKEFNTFSDEQIAAICGLLTKEQDSFSKKIHLLFEEAGRKKGDKVAVCGRNSSFWAVAVLAKICLYYTSPGPRD